MRPSQEKHPKRLDLQGIRALAIIVVLGFHFFPNYCPNGYLGVDQFFVLSGFLMCMLLKGAENQGACQLVSLFYSKRFKRILPLYLLLILVSMISLYSLFPDTAIETNQESAIHALLFMSNRPRTEKEDYFQMLSIAVDIFTHTWSLSVEIQFYFLVPFIFLLARKIPEKFQYRYYGSIGFISFLYCYTSPATVAFNSVFARIWQFLIGMAAYLVQRQASNYQRIKSSDIDELTKVEQWMVLEDSESKTPVQFSRSSKMVFSFFLVAPLIFITTSSISFSQPIIRPIVTIGTGLLILVSKDNRILSNKVLVYIGDISYALYLIHWPIYAFWKLTGDGDQFSLLLSLISSVILAIVTFETFEKWYLKLSSTSVGILVVLLFFLNLVVINKNNISGHFYSKQSKFPSLDNVTANMTVDDAIRLNAIWNREDQRLLLAPTCTYEDGRGPYGWCNHTVDFVTLLSEWKSALLAKWPYRKCRTQGLPKSGKYKIMTIGNSVNANHARVFYQECGHKAKSILQSAAFGCEPLYPSFHSQECQREFKDFEERVRKEKPDYVFIITRFISIGAPLRFNVTADDPIYQIMKDQMLKFTANINHKLFILDALPEPIKEQMGRIASLVKNGTELVQIDKLLITNQDYRNVRQRHAQLMEDCGGKCELVDYWKVFYNEETKMMRYFDERGFSYWTSNLHFSPHGIERLRPVWTEICETL